MVASASLHEKNTFLLYVLVVGVFSGNVSHDDITTFTAPVDDLSPLSFFFFSPPSYSSSNHSKHTYYFYLFLSRFLALFRKRSDGVMCVRQQLDGHPGLSYILGPHLFHNWRHPLNPFDVASAPVPWPGSVAKNGALFCCFSVELLRYLSVQLARTSLFITKRYVWPTHLEG